MADCASKILRHEGPLAFFTGFLPCLARIGPHSALVITVLPTYTAFVVRSVDALDRDARSRRAEA